MKILAKEFKARFSIWCGGVEVNDYEDISINDAERIALELESQGFDDVYIEIKEG